jgi:hypothetical protein
MKPTNKELAQANNVPASRISEWLKRGMPRDIELSKRWRINNARPRKPLPATKRQLQMSAAVPPGGDQQTWEARLQRARQTEIEVYRTLQNTLASGDYLTLSQLQSSHLRAIKEIAEAEKIAASAQIEAGELIPIETVRAIWREVLPPLKAEIERLPVITRSRCNPEHPEIAEAALRAETLRILTKISTLATKF